MIFANIEYLFLLILLIPYIIWYVMKRKKTEPTLQVSTTRMYMKAPKSWKIYLLHAPFVLRTVAIIMVILILARPQTTDNWQNNRNRRNRHHASSRRFYQYVGRRLETQPLGSRPNK